MKKILSGLLAVLILFSAMGIVSFAESEDIIIIHTNDVHCGIEDEIGYGGLALFRKQMEKEYKYVTMVDAGDAIQGAPIGTLSEGGYLTEMINYLGYDVLVPGNHEFDYGMERFLELAGKTEGGYYSCNLIDLRTGKTVFEPYKMISYGDVDVAYVGVTTPESFTKSTPTSFQDENGNYIYGFCEDETGEMLYNAIQDAVNNARSNGAEYVIGVFHLGISGVTEKWTSETVINNTYGIDAVIDGHSHEKTGVAKFVKNKKNESVGVTQTGTKMDSIGKMVITSDGEIKLEIIEEVQEDKTYTVQSGDYLAKIAHKFFGDKSQWKVIFELNKSNIKNPNRIFPGMTLVLPEGKITDADTDDFINRIKSLYEEKLKEVIGKSSVDLVTHDYMSGERLIRVKETNLGDLCADAFRYQLGVDIGLMNGGGIRAEIKTGDITYNDTLMVFPYGNMICAAEVTGQQILNALEMGSMNYPEESGGFLHVSGLSYTINTAVESSVVTDDKGGFVRVDGEYRVCDVMVGEEKLDVNKKYTVASHDYMLKSGGDGMTMFNGSRVVLDNVLTDVDILSKYINENLGGVIGAGYENAIGTGRIIIK